MAQTLLTNLINPQVMADMLNAKLPKAIKFSPIAKIDTTLAARAGNTITVPKYAYIGDAADVAEGVSMGTTVLTASSTPATVKKAGKAVEITDEAVLSGYGDPVGEASRQLAVSIASKIDQDCVTALTTVGGGSLQYDGSAAAISYNAIVNAVDVLEEEENTVKILFVHPKQITQLRLDADFKDINKYPLKTVMTGTIGEIAGCQVVPSKRIATVSGSYICPLVVTSYNADEEAPALTIYLKRQAELESDRDILAKTTVISADEHYTAVVSNDSKVVICKFKA